MTILVLGGTTEATTLVNALTRAGRACVLSLAGVTRAPVLPDAPSRIGGFGGAEGLAQWVRANKVSAIIDATHPFAARISANAVIAARQTQTALLRIERPGWRATTGDHWIDVDSPAQAVIALGPEPRRVWLTIGRQDLAPFCDCTTAHSWLVRSVDPLAPEHTPPGATQIVARGPFALNDELALMQRERIEYLVTKNSGAAATSAKLAAARQQGVRVIMIARPILPACESVPDSAQAIKWLAARHDWSIPRRV